MKIPKSHFHVVPPLVYSGLSNTSIFGQKLPIWTTHHSFLQSRRPEVTKHLYYVLSIHRTQIIIFLGSSSWTKPHAICLPNLSSNLPKDLIFPVLPFSDGFLINAWSPSFDTAVNRPFLSCLGMSLCFLQDELVDAILCSWLIWFLQSSTNLQCFVALSC